MSSPLLIRIARRSLPALSGLLAGAAGLSTAHLIAQFFDPNSSPVFAVGGAAIDATPTPLKEFAIRQFGTNDKHVLLAGIVVVLAALTMAVGVLAARRFELGVAAVVALGAVAVTAALNRPTATAAYAVPTAIGLVIAVGLLRLLLLPLMTARRAPSDPAPAADPTHRTILVEGSRRQFLVTGVGVGAATVVALGAGQAVAGARSTESARRRITLPGAAHRAQPLPAGLNPAIRGLTPFVTPNSSFYRVDTALSVPQLDPNSWRLKIEGMVDHPFSLSYSDILDMPLTERDITLTCVSNEVGGSYAGTARWLGVPLTTLMARAGLNPAAEQLFATASDGFTTSTPVKLALDGRDAMLVIGMNGEPLPTQHGFPARLIVPGLYGFVSACKWVTSIKATTYAADKSYWTKRKWATDAPIYTETRIDVPQSLATVPAGPVAVAGVAWAQRRGITKVEVSVDGGDWKPATLAPAAGVDTWRQWWFRWDATTGSHQLRARATDATGAVQTAARQSTFPRGATGIQEVVVTVG